MRCLHRGSRVYCTCSARLGGSEISTRGNSHLHASRATLRAPSRACSTGTASEKCSHSMEEGCDIAQGNALAGVCLPPFHYCHASLSTMSQRVRPMWCDIRCNFEWVHNYH